MPVTLSKTKASNLNSEPSGETSSRGRQLGAYHTAIGVTTLASKGSGVFAQIIDLGLQSSVLLWRASTRIISLRRVLWRDPVRRSTIIPGQETQIYRNASKLHFWVDKS